MPNFGLDQRKPRKKINRTLKNHSESIKKPNSIIIIGSWFLFNVYLKYLILNIVFLLKLFFSNYSTFRD
jgi:hypothetical protein